MLSVARFLGHVLVLFVCLLVGMITSGRYIEADYKIDGFDLLTLERERATALLDQGKKIEATTRIVLADRTYTVEGSWLVNIWVPLVASIGLVLVYLPGAFWPAAQHFAVRLGIVFGWAALATVVHI
jgi:hypothetical protein